MNQNRQLREEAREAARQLRGDEVINPSHIQMDMWKYFAKGDYDCEGTSLIEVLQFKIEKMKSHMLHCSDATLDYVTHTASDMQRTLDLGYRILKDDYNAKSSKFEEQNSDTVIHLENVNEDGSETSVKDARFRSADIKFITSDSLKKYLDEDELRKQYGSLVFTMETVWDNPKDDAIWKRMIDIENREKTRDVTEYFREVGVGSQKWWD
jgi:hypothetical protein